MAQRSHFFHHPFSKHFFHTAIDALIKLRAFAKDKDTVGCRCPRRAWPTAASVRDSNLCALLRDRFAAQQTNLKGTHDASPVFQVDLARNLRIKIDKLPAQFLEAPL